jgi:PH/SEC7 domain-containing protein
MPQDRIATPSPRPETGRTGSASTEKATRRMSGTSMLSLDKPLPPIQPESGIAGPSVTPETNPPRRSASTVNKGSMHVRHPADSHLEDDSPPLPYEGAETSVRTLTHSPARVLAMKTFTDDVNGMLDAFGQTEPAKELGLPPDSLREKDRADLTSGREKRFPVDLGRSNSAEPPRMNGNLLSPLPLPAQRTSSLPNGMSRKDGSTTPGSVSAQRNTPSPRPSPLDSVLGVQPVSTSRSSSVSSRRKKRPEVTNSEVPLGSPFIANTDRTDDFAPTFEPTDDTIRAPVRPLDPPLLPLPISPQSVRLVSPRPETPRSTSNTSTLNITSSALARSTFGGTLGRDSPWGKQSPKIQYEENNPIQIVAEEEEEEKGRRLACEFLDGDQTTVVGEKVAEFLGGP